MLTAVARQHPAPATIIPLYIRREGFFFFGGQYGGRIEKIIRAEDYN